MDKIRFMRSRPQNRILPGRPACPVDGPASLASQRSRGPAGGDGIWPLSIALIVRAPRIFLMGSVTMMMFLFFSLPVSAQEPLRPFVNADLKAADEAKIDALRGMPAIDAIERLKKEVFLVQEDYLNKAVYEAFVSRSSEAVDAAISLLRLPRILEVDNRKIDRTPEMFVAKKILQIFPDESMRRIYDYYKASNVTARGNLIEALGQMSPLQAREMLISALDDQSFIEEEDFEGGEGDAMRICDAAYNQLVVRYMISDVLRTLGRVHTLEQRDYHISLLKQKL